MSKKTAPLGMTLTANPRRPNQPEAPKPVRTPVVIELDDTPPAPVKKAKETVHLNISLDIHKALRLYAVKNSTTIRDVADEALRDYLREKGEQV